MASTEIDKPGFFYLGKRVDAQGGNITEEICLYDAASLTTHAVCVGMTGSGKTGLCLGLIEEAILNGIPVIAIDPKGDIGNLLLTFPELKGEDFEPFVDSDEARRLGRDLSEYASEQASAWRDGLSQWQQSAERVKRLKKAAEFTIYTPGSTAGVPISIVSSFSAPLPNVMDDPDAFSDHVDSTTSALLGLLNLNVDSLKSQEHILVATLLQNAWRAGEDLSLTKLIKLIQKPPITQVGALELEAFYPKKERMQLAKTLNNLLASPRFEAWTQGISLNVQKLLWTEAGKPRVAIFSIAHLDDTQRMFFTALLVNQLIGWMRGQSGTSNLRALFYMDEIFGYLPPTANPPSKKPLLTLLKQSRAFGLGLVLSTQNSADIDYKGLANAGTWFIGRLQTQRDKMRLLDGLEGAASDEGAGFDRQSLDKLLSTLKPRSFLMTNVKGKQPIILATRWTLSYLKGPLTRDQIKLLMKEQNSLLAASDTTSSASVRSEAESAKISGETEFNASKNGAVAAQENIAEGKGDATNELGSSAEKSAQKKKENSDRKSEILLTEAAEKQKGGSTSAAQKKPEKQSQDTFVNGPTAVFTSILTIVNLVVFLLMYKQDAGFLWHPTTDLLLKAGGDYGPLLASGQWWRIVTCGFVHAGLFHFVLNMYALTSIGAAVERTAGVIKFLIIYAASLIAGSLLSDCVHPYVISVGASGAIFGLLGCQLVMIFSWRHSIPRAVLINFLLSDLLTICGYIAVGFFIPQIDNYAHIGGLIGGIASGLALMPLNFQNKLPGARNLIGLAILSLLLLQANSTVTEKSKEATEAMTSQQKAQTKEMLKKYGWPFWLPGKVDSPAEGLGDAAFQCPDYQTALSMANKAVELDDQNGSVYYQRARVEHKFKHDLEAVSDLDKALDLKPHQYDFLCLKARLELALKRFDGLKSDLADALKIERKEHAQANDLNGCLELMQGRKKAALTSFNKAIAEDPESGAAFYHRAMLEDLEGNSVKSEQDYIRSQDKNYLPDQWDKENGSFKHAGKAR